MLEAEQREINEMRALMDAGNHTGALSIYQGLLLHPPTHQPTHPPTFHPPNRSL